MLNRQDVEFLRSLRTAVNRNTAVEITVDDVEGYFVPPALWETALAALKKSGYTIREVRGG